MRSTQVIPWVLLGLFVFPTSAQEPTSSDQSTQTIPLTVETGVPLRVYLTQRLPKRLDEAVHAKLLEPVFAIDREVIPAGSEVIGKVSRIDPESKMVRATAILGGDFTPLHQAEVQFNAIVLPGGRRIELQTIPTIGLSTIYTPPRGKAKLPANGGALGAGNKGLKSQVSDAIHQKTQSVVDVVRGPDKKERLEDFLIKKLPYHPQWDRKGTRFDAELSAPLQFGTATFKTDSLNLLGSQPPADSIVHVRLLTPLNSKEAEMGDKIEAVVSQPLFSAHGKLIVPEGTHLVGKVTVAQGARWFHRGGQMRFNFQELNLPPGLIRPVDAGVPATRTMATLNAAESGNKTKLKVDDEGGVKATESKTRFFAPAISYLIASRALDNDRNKITGAPESNTGGHTLGGGSGFGLLGAAAAQASRSVGGILAIYGMGWSVYTNIVSRGAEIEFEKDAAMDVRFGARTPVPANKFRPSSGAAVGATFN